MWTSTIGAGVEVKRKDDNTVECTVGNGPMKHDHGGLAETFWLPGEDGLASPPRL